MYPICVVISNISSQELPTNDEYVVMPIKGLSSNRRIDPRSTKVGYMCVIGSNVPYSRFFHWFNENVTYPKVIHIRRKYNPLSNYDAEEGQIPLIQEIIMWGNSDILYL